MKIKVIFVDDETDICENFSDYFSGEGVEVKAFSDVECALSEIKNNPPDVLFLDYRLPGITGDEIAIQLDPQIPKYLITGDSAVKTTYNFIKVFGKPYLAEEIAEVFSKYSGDPVS